ncbi:unnamed protein product [Lymnaea stagnalis]|uniref:Uncharacterized protein n=1 Tax=Lymnaea stagnalis TaxID=6523 RepID=A0AAV2HCW8_LYMST
MSIINKVSILNNLQTCAFRGIYICKNANINFFCLKVLNPAQNVYRKLPKIICCHSFFFFFCGRNNGVNIIFTILMSTSPCCCHYPLQMALPKKIMEFWDTNGEHLTVPFWSFAICTPFIRDWNFFLICQERTIMLCILLSFGKP